MIHDAKVEVTCDAEDCDNSTWVDLEVRYRNYGGGGAHYPADDLYVEDGIRAAGWIAKDGRHYCESCDAG